MIITEVILDAEAFLEIIAHLDDLAGRMRRDREMFGERESSDDEDHVTYLIDALQQMTPDAQTDHYRIRRVQKSAARS